MNYFKISSDEDLFRFMQIENKEFKRKRKNFNKTLKNKIKDKRNFLKKCHSRTPKKLIKKRCNNFIKYEKETFLCFKKSYNLITIKKISLIYFEYKNNKYIERFLSGLYIVKEKNKKLNLIDIETSNFYSIDIEKIYYFKSKFQTITNIKDLNINIINLLLKNNFLIKDDVCYANIYMSGNLFIYNKKVTTSMYIYKSFLSNIFIGFSRKEFDRYFYSETIKKLKKLKDPLNYIDIDNEIDIYSEEKSFKH